MADKENFDTEEKTKDEAAKKTEEEAPAETKAEESGDETSTEEKASDKSDAPGEEEVKEAPEKKEKKEPDEGEPKKQEKKPKKKLGGKPKKDPRDEKIEELTDKVKRQLAEFENFRTRSEKEKSMRYDMGASFVIEKMLPVLDNFERGLDTAPEGDAFAEGMHMIYKQMITTLEEIGVKPIEALGKEFDPELHNAVMQAEATEEYPSGTVAQELQKGYTYHDTVVRHSMVAVSQ